MQTFHLTWFYRFFYTCLTSAIAIGVTIAVGWPGAIAGAIAVAVAYVTNRMSLRVDDAGVSYRSWRPGRDWQLLWENLTALHVDKAFLGSRQGGGGWVHRLSFERPPQRPLMAEGYSTRSCKALLAVFEARGLGATYDDGEPKGG